CTCTPRAHLHVKTSCTPCTCTLASHPPLPATQPQAAATEKGRWSPRHTRPARPHVGDARTVLAEMPDESVNCIVTSAPYWAKRDYGVPGQYGHEPGPDAYIATLRSVFAEARRVLTGDGTCWLNLGDSYWAGSATSSRLHAYIGAGLAGRHTLGMGTKNLLGLPWRTALALQDDGWILRNAIVWHKPNAMPESVRDRLNCRHEMIFLLVKSRHYWFDLDPIRIPHATLRPQNHVSQPDAGGTSARRPPHAPSSTRRPGGTTRPPKYGPHTRQVIAARRYGNDLRHAAHPLGRNPGDVWSIPPAPT